MEAALPGRGWSQAEGSVPGLRYLRVGVRDHLGKDWPGVMAWKGKEGSS